MGKSRRFLGVAAMAAALLLVASPASAAGGEVGTDLSGAEEVPGPGDLNGWGEFGAKVKPGIGQICFYIVVGDIAVPVKGAPAHIHSGAAGVAGPVVVDLGKIPKVADQFGFSDTCLSGLSKPLLQDIVDHPENYYVNVHNGRFPAGAVRGQLALV
jgi:hypothetical protein